MTTPEFRASALIERLAGGAHTVRALVASVSAEDARWRPPSAGWSVLEIVNHLADEEAVDFRSRLRSTLEDPEAAWPGIDPEGDVTRLEYNTRDLAESAERFVQERAQTMEWLRGLTSPGWGNTHAHPAFGPLRAGDLLLSLAAHDALHLRQLAQRLYQLALRDGSGFETRYAGLW